METESTPPGYTNNHQDNIETTQFTQLSENVIAFEVDEKGMPVKVDVTINYPFYDVVVAGTQKAQLEQDLHSNWFKTTGDIPDYLVQLIGRKISLYITGRISS